jgi:seryl-tRNA synthetase
MCMSHDMSLTNEMTNLPGLHCYENGQVGLSDGMLAMWQQLDATFVNWAKQSNAGEHLFPALISVSELQKFDYFSSFPQLATFAMTLAPGKENLCAFRDKNSGNASGEVSLTSTDPVANILTPAACYHFYIHYQNRKLDSALHLTTRCTCHRREQEYVPLQRQWNFNMRELVCIGTEQEVDQFLIQQQKQISEFINDLNIEAHWQTATDPFFEPHENEKYLAQKLFPIKQELVLGNGLAIASINRHYQHFGDHFNITRNQQSAFSGCVAFGLERWLYAIATDKQKQQEK